MTTAKTNELTGIHVLAFTLTFSVLVMAPDLFQGPFSFFPLLKIEDPLALLAPWILIPYFWFLFQKADSQPATKTQTTWFLVTASIWAQSHGLHIGANAIGRLVNQNSQPETWALTYFLDEHFSHYLWAFANLAMNTLLLWRGRSRIPSSHPPADRKWGQWPVILSGIVYGITSFINHIEGQTAILAIGYSLIISSYIARQPMAQLRQRPLTLCFGMAYGMSLGLYLAWGIRWHGLPEFSAVGWLN